jgi:hypothetical protein
MDTRIEGDYRRRNGWEERLATDVDSTKTDFYTVRMDVPLTPEMATTLADLAATTGRGADELMQDACAGYLEELALLRHTLDSRYDDLTSGPVQPIDGDEALARLRAKGDHRRSRPV